VFKQLLKISMLFKIILLSANTALYLFKGTFTFNSVTLLSLSNTRSYNEYVIRERWDRRRAECDISFYSVIIFYLGGYHWKLLI
ncbi:hypothetical protein, partial [Staphylococcus condimenti]|uniref:hypothetical protein n=1 Tax=Staphylococcus condimenti TaxID=70255 RepID=UPI001A938B6E